MKQKAKDTIDEIAHDRLSDQVVCILSSTGCSCPSCDNYRDCELLNEVIREVTMTVVELN